MTARELGKIFEEYGIGHVELRKPFDNSNEIHAFVVDGNVNTDKWHFQSIEINDSTFGFETENDICDEDYDSFEICDLQFYTTSWAYPESSRKAGDDYDGAEKNCGIRLNDYVYYKNVGIQMNALYVSQACKMFVNPLSYQTWLLKKLMKEQNIFLQKHYPMLQEMGFWFEESGLFKRGCSAHYESEIWLSFRTITNVSNLLLRQNIFTGNLCIHVKNSDSTIDEYEVNELSSEELEKIIQEIFEKNGEYFWREERKFRETHQKEHPGESYDVKLFIEYEKTSTEHKSM